MTKAVLVLLALCLGGCPAHQGQPPQPEPTPPVRDTDWCGDAEDNLERMVCKDRRGDPMWVNRKGERFQETCQHAQLVGGIFLNPQCVTRAATCEEAKACPAN